jgi:hypothetical protein
MIHSVGFSATSKKLTLRREPRLAFLAWRRKRIRSKKLGFARLELVFVSGM